MDQELLAAALLHDTIELGAENETRIEEAFSERIVGLVKELTRLEPTLEETLGLDKKEIYELRTKIMLEEIGVMSADAKLIKLADRISNLEEALLVRTPEKLARYKGQTRLILQQIPRHLSPQLWDKLAALCDFE